MCWLMAELLQGRFKYIQTGVNIDLHAQCKMGL